MARPIVENDSKTPTQLYLTPAEREAFPTKATTKYRNRIARTKPHKDFPASIVPSPGSTPALANGIYHRSMPDRRRREHSFAVTACPARSSGSAVAVASPALAAPWLGGGRRGSRRRRRGRRDDLHSGR